MYNFITDKKEGKYFFITDPELHHLRVRRIRIGESVGIIYRGKLFKAKLIKIEKDKAILEALEEVKIRKADLHIDLFIGVPLDLKSFEKCIDSATQVGVRKIIPVICSRGYRDINKFTDKLERFNKIINESMKQSGNPFKPELKNPIYINSLKKLNHNLLILFDTNAKIYVNSIKLKKGYKVGIAIGPEGGFTEEEVKKLKSYGFESYRLRGFTLRTETATLAGISSVINLFSEES